VITRDEVSTWPDYDSGICKRMVEQTNAGPIGFHELSEEEADIANCTIGFLNVTRIGMDENADTIGSGTLVRIGSTSGVLTAAHVLDALPQNGQIGLVTFNRPGKIQKQSIVGAWDAVIAQHKERPLRPGYRTFEVAKFECEQLECNSPLLTPETAATH
jgi:hypothetical protein